MGGHADGRIRGARYSGYREIDGGYVAFCDADEVFRRAYEAGVRVLLRLRVTDDGELVGVFYTRGL